MFLSSLLIDCDTHVIRNIKFHKGVNFIVDETKSESSSDKDTGNNIGKTTVIRLINFCLDGSDKKIYQSKEFKKNINEEVKNFLTSKNVKITLTLKEDLNDLSSREVVICRNFLSRSKRIIHVNGKSIPAKDFDLVLKQEIFGFSDLKPTFKQLKAKNIRDDAERLENTVRVLGGFGKLEEYEALYLFWLGIEYPDAERKRRLIEERNIEDKLYTRLTSKSSKSKLTQFIKIIDREIEELEGKRLRFNINHDYESDLESLNMVRSNLNLFRSEQTKLNLRKSLIQESCIELKSELSNIDRSQLLEVYKQANLFIPDLQKTFSETIDFHDRMVNEKISFISEELPEIEARIASINRTISQLLSDEKELVDKLHKLDTVKELEVLALSLNRQYEERGRLEGLLKQIIESKDKLNDIDLRLQEIDKSMHSLDSTVQERVSSFNEHFSQISNNLYGEKFALSASFEQKKGTDQRFYKLYVDSLNGQTGTGKKKGEIASFDIAYIKFADEQRIKCLHFILHDQMEVVDDNQLIGLVSEIENSNCQFVVPILRDKLPSQLNDDRYEVLSLSQENKLFGI